MLAFITRRLIYMVFTLIAISIMSFAIIQLPPGDFVTSMAAKLSLEGDSVDPAFMQAMRARYGLDQGFFVQYWKWVSNIVLYGDFGFSLEWRRPVADLVWNRIGMTFLLALFTLGFMWLLAIPIGIYSAVRKNSLGDYLATFIGMIGLAIPNFLFALVLLFIGFDFFQADWSGMFSDRFQNAPWSFARLLDFLQHMILPIVVLGTAGTAALIRVLRANLLDELHKPYVVTARAYGLSESRLLFKYPVRVAMNPLISTIGWLLPTLISGATITAVVLNLPLTGPLLLNALLTQDMYLAGSFIMLMSALTVIGTLISDLLLAWADPRIRYA
ncbi:ABC transporter permease [Celeribacter indicus]|uniref:Binding-protein-dependent transport system inner membrane protein n=1 Tax=Celeribacter indicus TaxID=1208324 RepID=A0A0B5DXU4_9RHOB|nr:ABC transporter permease [Celeribacter indicus]AJE47819.1 binding-protein-dependent transport system inner membrane protein [Celeribacter indicus]SDW23933.1 peptide/nickel transport system permease protein [Celeribacter indicus]